MSLIISSSALTDWGGVFEPGSFDFWDGDYSRSGMLQVTSYMFLSDAHQVHHQILTAFGDSGSMMRVVIHWFVFGCSFNLKTLSKIFKKNNYSHLIFNWLAAVRPFSCTLGIYHQRASNNLSSTTAASPPTCSKISSTLRTGCQLCTSYAVLWSWGCRTFVLVLDSNPHTGAKMQMHWWLHLYLPKCQFVDCDDRVR